MRIFLLFFLRISLFAFDYDCVVVGTSPFSLFEALYRAHSGDKVLILEAASECGGAWKSINICGIENADLGCHQIGHDVNLKKFLEDYAGCKLVSLDNPLLPYKEPSSSPNGYYFSRGCFELVDHLLRLLEKTSAQLLLDSPLESILIDPSQTFLTITTNGNRYTASKMILTPMSAFAIEGKKQESNSKSKFYHLYMLIQDPTPPKFCYHGSVSRGTTRMMNLTHLVGLTDTGRQLLVFQTYNDHYFKEGETILNDLKMKNLVDASAYILNSEPHIFEQNQSQYHFISRLNGVEQKLFEVINTGHFQSLTTYISKWKTALHPYPLID